MKLEKVSKDKLKVTLTSVDVEQWNIQFDNFAYNTPEVQELFWDIMRRAENELEFFADGAQLFVEAVSTRTDGFILMVTKLDDTAPYQEGSTTVAEIEEIPVYEASPVTPSHVEPPMVAGIGKTPIIENAPIIFSFDDFDNAVNACKQIGNNFNGVSTLYKYCMKFYLVLELAPEVIDMIPTSALLEYGSDTYNPTLFHGMLSERGEVMINNNAVEVFCTHF